MNCLIPNCTREADIRGVCGSHYAALISLRKSNLLKYTMEEMISKGYIIAPKPLGRPKLNKKKESNNGMPC